MKGKVLVYKNFQLFVKQINIDRGWLVGGIILIYNVQLLNVKLIIDLGYYNIYSLSH